MHKQTIEATTKERKDAIAEAQEAVEKAKAAGDKAAVDRATAQLKKVEAENPPAVREVDLPDTLAEAGKMWGEDTLLKMAIDKYIVKLQDEMRRGLNPQSKGAMSKVLIQKLMEKNGVESIEELYAKMGG